MKTQETETVIRDMLEKYIALPIPIESIGYHENLYLYGLDELNIVRISVALEEKYDIIINDNTIINKELKTIRGLCEYVDTLQNIM